MDIPAVYSHVTERLRFTEEPGLVEAIQWSDFVKFYAAR